jgi:hypothetical protein
MAQYTAPVTAREALGDHDASSFLCSSDELRFDAPPRALADEEELQPGWLYFVLPVSMLRLALSGHEMAALAIRASTALAVAGGVASPPRRKNVAGGVASPQRRKNAAGANGRLRKTARVAPLVVADEGEYGCAGKTVHNGGSETVANTRKRAAYRSRGARRSRRAAAVQRLSAILEADEF